MIRITQRHNIDEMLMEIIDKGIDITISKDRDGEYIIDLGFGTKAHVYLYIDEIYDGDEFNSMILAVNRYNDKNWVEDIDDILSIFADEFAVRQFGYQKWVDWAVETGHLRKRVETVIEKR